MCRMFWDKIWYVSFSAKISKIILKIFIKIFQKTLFWKGLKWILSKEQFASCTLFLPSNTWKICRHFVSEKYEEGKAKDLTKM